MKLFALKIRIDADFHLKREQGLGAVAVEGVRIRGERDRPVVCRDCLRYLYPRNRLFSIFQKIFYKGASPKRKHPALEDPLRTLGIGVR